MRAYSSLSFVFLLLASSVVGAKDKSPPDPVTLPASLAGAPAESAGTVIGTLGYRTDNKPYVGSAALVFRRAGATDVGAIQYIRSTAKLQGDTQSLDDKKGEFHYAAFSMALPEGQYELIGVVANYGIMSGGNAIAAAEAFKTVKYGMAGAVAGGIGAGIGNALCSAGSTSDVTVSDGFSVPFEVKRGRVLYLGSFLAHGTLDHGKACFIPMPMPSKVYMPYADKWDRDRVAFPAVDASVLDHATLAVNERTGYYVIAEDHVVEAENEGLLGGSHEPRGQDRRIPGRPPGRRPAIRGDTGKHACRTRIRDIGNGHRAGRRLRHERFESDCARTGPVT